MSPSQMSWSSATAPPVRNRLCQQQLRYVSIFTVLLVLSARLKYKKLSCRKETVRLLRGLVLAKR